MVGKIDGELLADRLWVEQKLAYPINGNRKGTYWLSYFRCDSQKLGEFNRLCQLNETILRHMAVKIDERLVDAFVSHARGEKPSEPPATETRSDPSSSKQPTDEAKEDVGTGSKDSDEPAAETVDA